MKTDGEFLPQAATAEKVPSATVPLDPVRTAAGYTTERR